ncbi:MAG: hypothetical protein ABR977_05740 [Candidatus Dormibacteria bacterium]|jgi:hypothetical protein
MVRKTFALCCLLGCLLAGLAVNAAAGPAPLLGSLLQQLGDRSSGSATPPPGICVIGDKGCAVSTPVRTSRPVPTATPTSTPSPTATPTPTPPPPAVKPELSGLIDRTGAPPQSLAPYMGGWVVNVDWSQLQPASGTAIATDNPIDQALALIHSTPAYSAMHLRIRIFAGIDSPSWVDAMSGGSVYVYNATAGQGGQVPRFWTTPVEQAYAHLQVLLAAEYDANPVIEDVTTSGCMTVFAEPLIREVTDPTSVANLLAAGYTEAADQTCQEDALAAQGVWTHTHSSIALNPYQTIAPNGSTGIDESFTQSLMAYCHSTLGNRCTLGNNSIRTASLGTQYNQMYSSMKGTGPTLYFQTAQAALVGDLQSTVCWAIAEGANDVELPTGFNTMLTTTQMKADDQALIANTQ